MSANNRRLEEYLEYLPEKERKAAEKAIFREEKPQNPVMAIIKHTNAKKVKPAKREKGRRNLLKQY